MGIPPPTPSTLPGMVLHILILPKYLYSLCRGDEKDRTGFYSNVPGCSGCTVGQGSIVTGFYYTFFICSVPAGLNIIQWFISPKGGGLFCLIQSDEGA